MARQPDSWWPYATQCMSSNELDTAAFRAMWEEWEQHRREIRAPLTKPSVKIQIARLEKIGEAAAIAYLQVAIDRGWRGVNPTWNWQQDDPKRESKGRYDDI